MTDTLNFVATNNTLQQFAVVLQGLLLVIGAILNLSQKRR